MIKIDDLDEKNIEGFEIILKNWIEYDRVNFGEIILVFIRENLSGFIIINVIEF